MKRSFFQAAVVSILLYGCTTWMLTKRLEKKLDNNYRRMLRAILNKSWRQHPTRHQLYGHLPPITTTIQVRRTRHAGNCSRSRDELISDVLLWTPTYGRAKAGRPARTYIQQLCEDTGCSPEDLPEAINNREKWREMVRDIRTSGTTWWWWWWWRKRTHMWCDEYRRRKLMHWPEFKSWMSLFAFFISLMLFWKLRIQIFYFQQWVNNSSIKQFRWLISLPILFIWWDCYILTWPKMPFQVDAPEGSDTFQ